MTDKKQFSRLSSKAKNSLIAQMAQRKGGDSTSPARTIKSEALDIPDSLCDFRQLPGYKELMIHQTIANQAGIMEPYFQCHDGLAKDFTKIDGEEYLNFSTYDYLGLNGCERLNKVACDAVNKYGTSAPQETGKGVGRVLSGGRCPCLCQWSCH